MRFFVPVPVVGRGMRGFPGTAGSTAAFHILTDVSLPLPRCSPPRCATPTHLASNPPTDVTITRYERKRARKTRSFRRRQAPITRGQRRTLRELWPKYGLDTDFNARWSFDSIFSTPGAVNLDIGFGGGESLIGMATGRPNENFVGIEVHKPGVASALARLEANGLSNVRVVQGDAMTALADHIEDGSLSSCCIFFPDPFPQDRDSERRIVRPLLLSLLSSKLRPGGYLHVATDVDGYAEHTARVVADFNRRAPPNPHPPATTEGEELSSLRPPPSSLRIPQNAAAIGTEAVGTAMVSRAKDEEEEGRNYRRQENITNRELARTAGQQQQQQQQQARAHSMGRLFSDYPCARWEGGETAGRPTSRPLTKYEEKAREAGRQVRDIRYRLELPAAAAAAAALAPAAVAAAPPPTVSAQ